MNDQDQDNLSFKERYAKFKDYYDNNPVALVEDFNPDIKLLPYQKIILNAMMVKDKTVSYINPYTAHKIWLSNMRLELMKLMGMDFTVLSPSGRDDYEKGVLVEEVKNEKWND